MVACESVLTNSKEIGRLGVFISRQPSVEKGSSDLKSVERHDWYSVTCLSRKYRYLMGVSKTPEAPLAST